MNRRYIIYAVAAAALLTLIVARWSCRRGLVAPQGNSIEALLAQIDVMRQNQSSADVDRLLELTGHESQRVALAAVYALGHFKSAAARDALKNVFETTTNPAVRAAAADALGQSASDPQALIEILQSHPDPKARMGAARGLARYSTPQRRDALPALVKALRDPHPDVRAWAIRGVYRSSIKRFLYDPKTPPEKQTRQIEYIERRLRELKLMD